MDRSGNVYFSGGCLVEGGTGSCGAVIELQAVNGSIPPSPNETVFDGNFNNPTGVAVDASGNVYVADTGNNAIKEIVAINGSVSTSSVQETLITFTGSAGPAGVAVAASGNVYVADIGNSEAYEVFAVNGSIPASPVVEELGSGLNKPGGAAVDASGNVYLADTFNDRVLKITPAGENLGSFSVGTASPAIPMVFAFESAGTLGSVAVLTQGATGLDFASADTGTCAANTAYTSGQTCTVNITFQPKLTGPRYGAAVLKDSSGNVIATGYLQGTGIGAQINFLPGAESTVASSGLTSPYAVGLDGSGSVYIADDVNNFVWKETLSGGSYAQSAVPTSSLSSPTGVAVDGSGSLYIADTNNNRVLKETPSAAGYTESVVANFADNSADMYPIAVAVDGAGDVYVGMGMGDLYVETPLAGSYIQSTIPTPGASSLVGVAVDGSGNVYVADSGTNQVFKETLAQGAYTQSIVAASGVSSVTGIAVDAEENVYICDPPDNRVLKETLSAGAYTQSTVSTSQLLWPLGVAVDGSGNVYIADTENARVLKEDLADAPNLAFAAATIGTTSSDSPQTITVQNVGNAMLNFPSLFGSSNPSISANFSLDSSVDAACPEIGSGSSTTGTLPAGASCQLSVSFAPTLAGALSGSLVLTDNNLNAEAPNYTAQNIPLGGTGIALTPSINWPTPAPISYGTALGSAQLNATASAPGVFAYTPPAGTVLPAGTQTLSVTFTPDNASQYASATATVQLQVYSLAALTSPVAGSVLPGSSATFQWSAGYGPTAYKLMLGTRGTGSANLFESGATKATSVTVDNLPTDGQPVYARLDSKINGVWQSVDYTLTASGSVTLAALTYPAPGSVLLGSSATFQWSAGNGPTAYRLRLGTSGPGSGNLFESGATTDTSVAVDDLPTNGVPVYARLYSKVNGVWQSVDYIYTSSQ